MKHVRSVQGSHARQLVRVDFCSWASSGADAQENFLEKMYNNIKITKVLVKSPSYSVVQALQGCE